MQKNEFKFQKEDYPIEEAIKKVVYEIAFLIRRVRVYIGRKPEDNFEKMIKSLELTIWFFLTTHLIGSFLNWWR